MFRMDRRREVSKLSLGEEGKKEEARSMTASIGLCLRAVTAGLIAMSLDVDSKKQMIKDRQIKGRSKVD